MIKSYHWKKERLPKFEGVPTTRIDKQEEFLTGEIDGKSASAPEERLANASRKYANFIHKFIIGTQGEPDWKELDFLFESYGQITAVEVDGEFTHRGEILEQQLDDLVRIEGLRKLGISVDKIIHIEAAEVASKELAQRTARELLA